MNYIAIAISIGTSIVSGVALFFIKRYFDNKDAKDIASEKARHTISLLTLRSINAIGKLTEANSIALRDGKTNGEMKAALEEYSKVNKELLEFLLEQVANKN